LLGWGLRRGDPAAVFDLKTGQLGWLPVNAQERVQVGHYYLLKRDYGQAWNWYQEADRQLPPPAPVVVHDMMHLFQSLQGPRDFSFFEYHCLTKLGRAEEARAKLDQFQRLVLPKFAEAGNGLDETLRGMLAPSSFVGSLLKDMYSAEVFLSLDAPQDAEAFFRSGLGQADSDAARLSRAIVLGQILLLEKKYQGYANLTTETIAPLLAAVLKSVPAGRGGNLLDPTNLVELVGEMALLPMGASDFLARLPEQQIREMRSRWEIQRAKASDASRPLLDLVLHGLYRALGLEQERREAAARIKNRQVPSLVLPVSGEVDKDIVRLHNQMRDLLQRR
jgi:tetratricopeptide (TPR) repeat protein